MIVRGVDRMLVWMLVIGVNIMFIGVDGVVMCGLYVIGVAGGYRCESYGYRCGW